MWDNSGGNLNFILVYINTSVDALSHLHQEVTHKSREAKEPEDEKQVFSAGPGPTCSCVLFNNEYNVLFDII